MKVATIDWWSRLRGNKLLERLLPWAKFGNMDASIVRLCGGSLLIC